MKHVNPNMISAVLKGIAEGETIAARAGFEAGDMLLFEAYDTLDKLSDPVRTGGFLRAKAVADAQGFIAAYRSATEFS